MTSFPTDPEARTEEAQHLADIEEAIAAACSRAGRAPSDVKLVAISKDQTDEAVRNLSSAGHKAFGENKVQAYLRRREAFSDFDWHVVGPVQTNKAKDLAKAPPLLLHTVDRPSLVAALDARLQAPLDCLIQVDIDREASKSGVDPDALDALVDVVAASQRLRLLGLMCIPKALDEVGEAALRQTFGRMRACLDAVRDRVQGRGELSMGMSDDFHIAVEEGATIVRIGTALFGLRPNTL